MAYLLNKSNCGSKPIEAKVTSIGSIQLDCAGLWIIPSFKEANDGTFSRATSTLCHCKKK